MSDDEPEFWDEIEEVLDELELEDELLDEALPDQDTTDDE